MPTYWEAVEVELPATVMLVKLRLRTVPLKAMLVNRPV
jgi:hypothetical protein